MLINLSHHPSADWPEEQKRATEPYGEVSDLPFPKVDPEADAGEVAVLSRQHLDQCAELLEEASGQNSAVHIMGEMTFVYQFVRQAVDLGLVCLASTTRRAVDWDDSGDKISRFEFVRFRAYMDMKS